MKMQKFVIFAKKHLKINIQETENVVKLEIIVSIQEKIETLGMVRNIVCLKKFL